MNKKFMAGAAFAGCMAIAVAAAKDPVLMTVDGVPVTLSEFEYLYNKNSQQQIQPQTLDEYLERYKIYRLKLADALNEGFDTIPSLVREIDMMKSELAQSHLTDSTYMYKLAREVYDHSQEEVDISHIARLKSTTSANIANRHLLDSLRNELAKGANFSDLAMRFSEDRNVTMNGGHLGTMAVNRFPYDFEAKVYAMKPGQTAVLETPSSIHLVKVNGRRPARNEIQLSYIVKQDGPQAKALIDSISQVIRTNPNMFEEMAMRYSDDKSTGRNGGLISAWLDASAIPPEMAEEAYSLTVNQISEPFKSGMGWMIVKKIDERKRPGFEQSKAQLAQQVNHFQNDRSMLVTKDDNRRLAKKCNAKLNNKTISDIHNYLAVNGIDSTFYTIYAADNAPVLFTIGKQDFDTRGLLSRFGGRTLTDPEGALLNFDGSLDRYYNSCLTHAAEEILETENSEYRNLLKEFHDGSLVYEISAKKVYNRAGQDTEGLQKYFENHRDDYKWDKPHVKGYLVQAASDTVANQIRQRMQQPGDIDSIARATRKEFAKLAQIDKILKAEGEDPLIDALVFGAQKVEPSQSNFTTYFIVNGEILQNPESVEDVRGLVINDYQNFLEDEWVEEIKNRYKIEVDEKTLKKLR